MLLLQGTAAVDTGTAAAGEGSAAAGSGIAAGCYTPAAAADVKHQQCKVLQQQVLETTAAAANE